MIADLANEITTTGIDACTLNNVLNVAQLVALLVLIKWLRAPAA